MSQKCSSSAHLDLLPSVRLVEVCFFLFINWIQRLFVGTNYHAREHVVLGAFTGYFEENVEERMPMVWEREVHLCAS